MSEAAKTAPWMSPKISLYPQLVGAAWVKVAEPVRRLHTTFAPERLRGRFEVRHGDNRLARWLARRLRFPSASNACEVGLSVEGDETGESWRRSFDGIPLLTRQRAGVGTQLCEQFGWLEFRFDLEVVAGALIYRQRMVLLRLGCCVVRLPSFVAPWVGAREDASNSSSAPAAGVEVVVEVRWPPVGLLLAYRGVVWRAEGEAL